MNKPLLGLLVATPALALSAFPDGGGAAQQEAKRLAARYHQAYWLEHSEGDLEGARSLYEEVASMSMDPSLQQRARRAARAVGEDLAAEDLTRLMPPATLAYVELQDTGARLEGLLGELGLLSDGSWSELGAAQPLPGLSPHLLRGMLGVRALGLAVTRIDPTRGQPVGLAVLHPGSDAMARGLAETLVQNGAIPADSIQGCATWEFPDAAHVTFTERLVILSQSRREIAGAIQRLRKGGKSFADSPALTSTRDLRGEDLAFFCINTEPLMPFVQMGLAFAAAEEPRIAALTSLLDPGSLRAITGRIGVGREGLGLDLALQLKEGHDNLAYSFLRMPSVDDAVLDLVPEGAAFVLAAGLNEPDPGSAGIVDSRGGAVVTWMDTGRELFGNLVDVVLFGMPEQDELGSPSVAAILRVNDIERSFAMWDLLLGVATQGSTGQKATVSEVAGASVSSYSVDGQALHVARSGGELVVSPSMHAIERALVARKAGYGARQDETMAAALEPFESGRTLALVTAPSRLAGMLEPYAPLAEREALARAGELLGDSIVSLDLTHSETRLGFHLGLTRLPDLRQPATEVVSRLVRGMELPDVLQGGPIPAAAKASSWAQR